MTQNNKTPDWLQAKIDGYIKKHGKVGELGGELIKVGYEIALPEIEKLKAENERLKDLIVAAFDAGYSADTIEAYNNYYKEFKRKHNL